MRSKPVTVYSVESGHSGSRYRYLSFKSATSAAEATKFSGLSGRLSDARGAPVFRDAISGTDGSPTLVVFEHGSSVRTASSLATLIERRPKISPHSTSTPFKLPELEWQELPASRAEPSVGPSGQTVNAEWAGAGGGQGMGVGEQERMSDPFESGNALVGPQNFPLPNQSCNRSPLQWPEYGRATHFPNASSFTNPHFTAGGQPSDPTQMQTSEYQHYTFNNIPYPVPNYTGHSQQPGTSGYDTTALRQTFENHAVPPPAWVMATAALGQPMQNVEGAYPNMVPDETVATEYPSGFFDCGGNPEAGYDWQGRSGGYGQ